MKKITIVMPVYNEELVIEEIVREYLAVSCADLHIYIVIVDDKSTDSTPEILARLNDEFPNRVTVKTNIINSGHGMSLLNGFEYALETHPHIVISCDGDGPLSGKDLRLLLLQFGDKKYLEVCRVGRTDPYFRRVVSFLARILVLIKSRRATQDANTPIRFYSKETLKELLPQIKESNVPNLLVSIIARISKYQITLAAVTVQERKGKQPGTMWGKSKLPRFLPNSRFILFTYRSFLEVLRTDLRIK